MNLKESFRYQNFLDKLLREACYSIESRTHALAVVKTHNKSKANPDAVDVTETVEVDAFYPNDDVIRFMQWLVGEREKITEAIGKTKVGLDFDIDAAIETNKFRQTVNTSVRRMLAYTPSKTTERGQDYKFNAEGNQMPYYYEIDVNMVAAYDKDSAKDFIRSVITKADSVSAEIDYAMVNSIVDYEPRFDVNDSFEDVMDEFINS